MTPQEYNFKHRYKGDTSDSVSFTITQTVSEVTTPIDLTGASIKMQFKKTENATSVIKAFGKK